MGKYKYKTSGVIIPSKFYNPPFYPEMFNGNKAEWLRQVNIHFKNK